MLGVLKLADRTFERKQGHDQTAINAKGFEVDFLRRQPIDGDPHPFRFPPPKMASGPCKRFAHRC